MMMSTPNLVDLFGREAEVTELLRVLLDDSLQLIAIVGASGAGKTFLAKAVMQHLIADHGSGVSPFSDGVHLVSFADLRVTYIAETSINRTNAHGAMQRKDMSGVSPPAHFFEDNNAVVATASRSSVIPRSMISARTVRDANEIFVLQCDCAYCSQCSAETVATFLAQKLNIASSPHKPMLEQLGNSLAGRRILLILDSFDRVRTDDSFLLALLQAAPTLKILVTSQTSLEVPTAYQLRLNGLSLPPSRSEISDAQFRDAESKNIQSKNIQSKNTVHDEHQFGSQADKDAPKVAQTIVPRNREDAIAFFCRCATEFDPTFRLTADRYEAIWEICHLVDGSPLGIALAAELLNFYDCTQIAGEIRRDYTVLASNRLNFAPRHRAMATVYATLWQQIPQFKRLLLLSCSLFVGQFSRDALLQITSATPIQVTAMIKRRLLHYDAKTERFFVPLLLYQYVVSQQPAHSVAVTRTSAQHAAYYLNLVHKHEQQLLTDKKTFSQIADAMPNIERAWQWAVANEEFVLLGRAVYGLTAYHRLKGLFQQAVQYLLTPLEAFTKRWLPWLQQVQIGQHTQSAMPSAEEIKALRAFFSSLATLYLYQGNEEQLTKVATEMLQWSERLQDPLLRGLAYDRFARAAQICDQVLPALIYSKLVVDLSHRFELQAPLLDTYLTLGIGQILAGDYKAAIRALTTILDNAEVTDLDLKMRTGFYVGLSHQRLRNHSAAHFHYSQAIVLGRHFPYAHDLAPPMIMMAEIWRSIGEYQRAEVTLQEVIAEHKTLSPIMTIWLLIERGRVAFDSTGASAAYELFMQALRLAGQANFRALEQRALLFLGHTLFTLGATVDAQIYYQRAYTLQQSIASCHWTADATIGLARLAAQAGDRAQVDKLLSPVIAPLLERKLQHVEEPYWAYWHLHKLLEKNDDPRAAHLLQQGQAMLCAEATLIVDDEMRQSFLTNVVINRNLLAIAGSKDKG